MMTLANAITITEQVLEVRPTLAVSDLSKVTCPVLLMIGERSVSPFPETLDRLQEIIPHAQRITVPGASHMINTDSRAVFIEELGRFLQLQHPPLTVNLDVYFVRGLLKLDSSAQCN